MSVLLLSDLFVQLNTYSFVMCHVQIFQQITMDGRMSIIIMFWAYDSQLRVVQFGRLVKQ